MASRGQREGQDRDIKREKQRLRASVSHLPSSAGRMEAVRGSESLCLRPVSDLRDEEEELCDMEQ